MVLSISVYVYVFIGVRLHLFAYFPIVFILFASILYPHVALSVPVY